MTEVVVRMDDGGLNLALFITFLIVYGGILVWGGVMCAVFSICLFRGRKVLVQWPFFRIVKNLTILDGFFIISQISKSFPDMIRDSIGCNQSYVDLNETFTRAEAWTNSIPLNISMELFDYVPNKGLIYLSLLMTLNRLAVFVYPKWRRIFDRGTILYPILSCWTVVLSLSALTSIVTPTQIFNKETLRFEASGEPLVAAPWLMHVLSGIDYLVPFIIAAMYMRIYYAIRGSRRVLGLDWVSEERTAEDRKMLSQALIICAFLVLYNIANLLAMIFQNVGWAQRVFGMCELILSVLNHSIHATLFIMTNSTIRKFLPVPSNLCSKSNKKRHPSVATSADKQYN